MKGRNKTTDRWESVPYIVTRQPHPSIPVYEVTREGDKKMKVLHRNELSICRFKEREPQKMDPPTSNEDLPQAVGRRLIPVVTIIPPQPGPEEIRPRRKVPVPPAVSPLTEQGSRTLTPRRRLPTPPIRVPERLATDQLPPAPPTPVTLRRSCRNNIGQPPERLTFS